MTTTDTVRQARTPQEAMLAIAEALDRIEALATHEHKSTEDWMNQGWVPPNQGGEILLPEDALRIGTWGMSAPPRAPVTINEDTEAGVTDVVLTKPSEEKMERRRMFERQSLKLAESLGDESTDWNETYAKGGPLWLYHGNRELVMSYPYTTRQALVADLEEDAPALSAEMGRDVLKHEADASEDGRGVAMGDSYYPSGVAR